MCATAIVDAGEDGTACLKGSCVLFWSGPAPTPPRSIYVAERVLWVGGQTVLTVKYVVYALDVTAVSCGPVCAIVALWFALGTKEGHGTARRVHVHTRFKVGFYSTHYRTGDGRDITGYKREG